MSWPNTGPHVTVMENPKTHWNWSMIHFPREAMRHDGSRGPAQPETAVARVYSGSRPKPTPCWLTLHVLPKPIRQCKKIQFLDCRKGRRCLRRNHWMPDPDRVHRICDRLKVAWIQASPVAASVIYNVPNRDCPLRQLVSKSCRRRTAPFPPGQWTSAWLLGLSQPATCRSSHETTSKPTGESKHKMNHTLYLVPSL